MRTRIKDDSIHGLKFTVFTTPGSIEYTYPVDTYTIRSYMIDDIDTQATRRAGLRDGWGQLIPETKIQRKIRPEFPCFHEQARLIGQTVWPRVRHPWYNYPLQEIGVDSPGPFRMPRTFDDPPLPDVAEDYAEFIKNCSRDFTQQFRGTSLANFLYELKDFKELKETFSRAALAFSTKVGYARGKEILKKEAKGEGRRRFISGVSGNYLDYQLNWKALVSDIPKLFSFYREAMARLEVLIGYSQFQEHRRLRFKIAPNTQGFIPIDVLDLQHDAGPPGYLYSVWLEPLECQVTFNVSAHIDNQCHMDAFSLWDVMADQLGLNNSPKILWNATKLSWVVDFFLDSKDFINAFEKQALNGALAVKGGACSLKIVRTYTIMHRRSINGGAGYFDESLGVLEYKHYVRTPLAVLLSGWLELDTTLTTDQSLLLGALASSSAGVDRRSAELLLGLAAAGKRKFRDVRWKLAVRHYGRRKR